MSATASVYPVILCGGSGTRLWPVSRKAYPKQFVPFLGEESLFQATLRRVNGPIFAPPLLMTANDFRFTVAEQARQVGIKDATILIEPVARNTAPAILAAALWVLARDPDGVLLVLPSDHVHRDEDAFSQAVLVAAEAAAMGEMVTFGVVPTRPETGFGYIELGASVPDLDTKSLPFLRFVEKPNAKTAADMIETGRFLWNSGSFCFSARRVVSSFETLAPQLLAPTRGAVEDASGDLDFVRLGDSYADCIDISIDFAIMEKISNGRVVPISSGWNDMGSWKTVWQESSPDAQGLSLSGRARAIDCQESLLRSESPDVELFGIGLRNIVAVATGDAVLVADMDRSQDVKLAVQQLQAAGAKQASEFACCHRPWGWYETLSLGPRFQVKRIMVKPGAMLSLQSHVHRAEHWVVVTGAALVTIDGVESLLGENQSTYIPLGAVHRLKNPGKVELHLIEVQSGAYLGEDDIVRYEDIYARD